MNWINELINNIQEELDEMGHRVPASEIKKFVIKAKQESNGSLFVSSKKLAQMYLKKGGERKCLR